MSVQIFHTIKCDQTIKTIKWANYYYYYSLFIRSLAVYHVVRMHDSLVRQYLREYETKNEKKKMDKYARMISNLIM